MMATLKRGNRRLRSPTCSAYHSPFLIDPSTRMFLPCSRAVSSRSSASKPAYETRPKKSGVGMVGIVGVMVVADDGTAVVLLPL